MEVTTPSEVTLYEYGYDWFDRLTSVSIGINGATPSLVRAYQFDEGDNRVFYDDYNEGPNGATYYYTYRTLGPWASDQLETVYIYSAAAGHRTVGDFTVAYEQFEYDDDGHMTKRTVAATGEEINYEWSDYNRLLKVTSTVNGVLQEAKYDIDGIRDRRTDKNGNTAIEYPLGYMTTASRPRDASSNAPTISYIQGPNGFLGYEEDGQMRYFVLDALQSVTNIVDSSKNVVQSYQYDEWGNHMSGSGSGSVQSPKTYWGGLSVNDETADTGLYLAGHRLFDPKLGRFISRDPIGHSGGLNLYALSSNNPVSYADPTGLFVEGQAARAAGKAVGKTVIRIGPIGNLILGAELIDFFVLKPLRDYKPHPRLSKDKYDIERYDPDNLYKIWIIEEDDGKKVFTDFEKLKEYIKRKGGNIGDDPCFDWYKRALREEACGATNTGEALKWLKRLEDCRKNLGNYNNYEDFKRGL